MLHENETGEDWTIIEYRNHLLVIKRNSDGLLRTILADTTEYAPIKTYAASQAYYAEV